MGSIGQVQVPGDLLTDLEAAGVIGDPLYETTFLNSSIWNSHDWMYATTFRMTASDVARVQDGSVLLLVFEGIKMGGWSLVKNSARGCHSSAVLSGGFSCFQRRSA